MTRKGEREPDRYTPCIRTREREETEETDGTGGEKSKRGGKENKKTKRNETKKKKRKRREKEGGGISDCGRAREENATGRKRKKKRLSCVLFPRGTDGLAKKRRRKGGEGERQSDRERE